jgi:hypothetical protein
MTGISNYGQIRLGANSRAGESPEADVSGGGGRAAPTQRIPNDVVAAVEAVIRE